MSDPVDINAKRKSLDAIEKHRWSLEVDLDDAPHTVIKLYRKNDLVYGEIVASEVTDRGEAQHIVDWQPLEVVKVLNELEAAQKKLENVVAVCKDVDKHWEGHVSTHYAGCYLVHAGCLAALIKGIATRK